MPRSNTVDRPGVYAIVNLANNKVYVGSTVNLSKRFSGHRQALRRGDHPSTHLQHAWTKYGEDTFDFRVLELCTIDELLELEQAWSNHYCSYDPQFGYNIREISRSNQGVKLSDETKAKLSAAHKGKKQTPQHAANQIAARTGRKNSLLQRIGMAFSRSRIPDEVVSEIQRLLGYGTLSNAEIAERTGVSEGYVSKVKQGVMLRVNPDRDSDTTSQREHVVSDAQRNRTSKALIRIPDETVAEIQRLLGEGYSYSQIAAMTGVTKDYVYKVKHRKMHRFR